MGLGPLTASFSSGLAAIARSARANAAALSPRPILVSARSLRTLKLSGCSFSHLALNGKDVGQFAIKGIRPNMAIVGCVDELDVYADRVATLLHAPFQNVCDAKLSGDFR
jgi:hypothetical protein